MFVDYRVQPIFCKDSANKANGQEIEGEYLGNKGSNECFNAEGVTFLIALGCQTIVQATLG